MSEMLIDVEAAHMANLEVTRLKLLEAVENNDIKNIIALVEEHKDLLISQYQSHDYQTILIIACNDLISPNVTKETVEVLIKLGANCNEPSRNDHWEPLHYTAINANRNKMEAIIQHLSAEEINSLVCCSKEVLQKYNSSTKKKTYSNNALSILLKFANKQAQFYECCQLLIEKGIDLKQADSTGVTPHELIEADHIKELGHLLQKRNSVNKDSKTLPFWTSDKSKKNALVNITKEEAESYDGKNENCSSGTALQICCAEGLTERVEQIIKIISSPNTVLKKKNPEHPVMIAIKNDHQEIVKLLLKRQDLVLPTEILLHLQKLCINKKKTFIVDKYIKLIIKHLQREKKSLQQYLFAKDDLDRTVLYYSIHYRCTETTLTLLSMGASLITEDIFGYTPLDFISPNILEQYFNSCVSVVDAKEDAGIITMCRKRTQQFSIKINYESLVKNPEEEKQESKFLEHMIKVTNLNQLMNHPVITSFLGLKWQKFKWWVYINLTLYFIAYISLLVDAYLFLNHVRTSIVLLTIAYTLLLCRDCIQISILRSNYLKRAENIIDIVLIGAITYVIGISWFPVFHNRNFIVACSIVLLASTLGIFMQLGYLSFFTKKVAMFKHISVNFFKAMAFYIIPVLAFFFCFYMLMQEADSDNSFERTFFGVLYTTITMYAGDTDSDFPNNFKMNPKFGQVVYTLFVIVIAIILQNLLIGLAVSDLQDIHEQAKFICNKEQARYIFNIEKIICKQYKTPSCFNSLLKKILNFLKVFESERVLVIHCDGSQYMYVKESGKKNQTKIRDYDTVRYLKNIFKDVNLSDKTRDEMYSNKKLHEKLEKLESLVMKIVTKKECEEKNNKKVTEN